MFEVFYDWWSTDAYGEPELCSDCAGVFYSYAFASALTSELIALGSDACIYLLNEDGSKSDIPLL